MKPVLFCQHCGQAIKRRPSHWLLKYQINGANFKRTFATERAMLLYAAFLRDNGIDSKQFAQKGR